MKKVLAVLLIAALSGCASLQTPKETNVAVSSLLDEIQIAVNEISERTRGTSLPPFHSAEITLSTRATTSNSGEAALVLSGKASRETTDSNVITLELVPGSSTIQSFGSSTGHDIAEYVIASVSAIDSRRFLKLKTLTIQAGLDVVQTAGGGIKVELVGVSVGGQRSVSSATGNSLKLVFSRDDKVQ